MFKGGPTCYIYDHTAALDRFTFPEAPAHGESEERPIAFRQWLGLGDAA